MVMGGETGGGVILKLSGKTILVCDCAGTMPIDGASLAKACGASVAPRVHHALCRSEIATFEDVLGDSVVVACTQEEPLFQETAAKTNSDVAVNTVNIREHAAWGEEANRAEPKIAALVSAAAVDRPPTPSVTLTSQGRTLVYGCDETALDAACQLASRLNVTLLLDAAEDVIPPMVMNLEIARGHVSRANGHLGAFRLVLDGYASADPSSRSMLSYSEARDGVEITVDLILDLSRSAPLFGSVSQRDGYFKPDARSLAGVQRSIFELVDLIGTFDKPRYVDYDADICVHSRSEKIGCSRCIDNCPNTAIAGDGDGVSVDNYVCGGCGQCASLCPTGAITYAVPGPAVDLERLRVLLGAYRTAGGAKPVLLVYDHAGEEVLSAIGRFGRGLPANVLPYSINEVRTVGLDLLLLAAAYGAETTLILCPRHQTNALQGLLSQIEILEIILEDLGIAVGGATVLDESDPDLIETKLFEVSIASTGSSAFEVGKFLPMGGKRDRMWLALDHLRKNAVGVPNTISLPSGAPFGAVNVNLDGCTLCLACVSACPTGALLDNQDKPQLSFLEHSCVQCGLCRTTCPESVIALEPRIDFGESARVPRVLKEEEPFKCVRCSKPFGVRSSVEHMIDKLKDHPMFANDGQALDRIRMCEDCRVVAQFDTDQPFALGSRPKPRTRDDYLNADGEED
ncbi:MAG: Electron transport complex subunit RsxB [Alphaproteobacteria bacterium MarineAlpha9_Bin7]|nr:MAG: Electron transport complex subunit RsxB [Alphaproteobacteria bacterium MarineAlpha9_Bin7]